MVATNSRANSFLQPPKLLNFPQHLGKVAHIIIVLIINENSISIACRTPTKSLNSRKTYFFLSVRTDSLSLEFKRQMTNTGPRQIFSCNAIKRKWTCCLKFSMFNYFLTCERKFEMNWWKQYSAASVRPCIGPCRSPLTRNTPVAA
jgi:hypothetical protein